LAANDVSLVYDYAGRATLPMPTDRGDFRPIEREPRAPALMERFAPDDEDYDEGE
jgi:hypothetical protein